MNAVRIEPQSELLPPEFVPDVSAIERRVLQALSHGLQSKQIAEVLGRKTPTIEGYIRILYVKFGAKSRAHLVACAYRCGLVD